MPIKVSLIDSAKVRLQVGPGKQIHSSNQSQMMSLFWQEVMEKTKFWVRGAQIWLKSVCTQFINGLELFPYSYLQVVDSTGPGITTNWQKGSHSILRHSQKMTETLRGLESPIKTYLKFTICLVKGIFSIFLLVYMKLSIPVMQF